MSTKRTWQEELEIVDRTMRAISSVTDPEEIVDIYWDGIGVLLPAGSDSYMAVSRRNVAPPHFLVTRSSRFQEHFNPWTQRDRLPRLSGGLAGEILYGGKPVVIDDLPARLKPDDPAYFYLQGFQSLIALPTYDGGEALNFTFQLFPPGVTIERSVLPMMHWQASLFGRGTQNLVLKNQLAAALGALDRELKVVGEIQRSLLPRSLPTIAGFDLDAFYATSAQAGGDYYDFFPIADGRWGILIADVSGHGTPAAVVMAIMRAIAHTKPSLHASPTQLLGYLNTHLAKSYTQDGTFVTAFYAVLDPKAKTLTYSSAGHNPPRLVRGERAISLDGAGALPLGIFPEQSHPEATVDLQPEDLLLVYTDGITETMGPSNAQGQRQLFGTDRLDRLLVACKLAGPEECIRQVRAAIQAFSEGQAPADDQTVIAMRCL